MRRDISFPPQVVEIVVPTSGHVIFHTGGDAEKGVNLLHTLAPTIVCASLAGKRRFTAPMTAWI